MLHQGNVGRGKVEHPADDANRKLIREVVSKVEGAAVALCDLRRMVEQRRHGLLDESACSSTAACVKNGKNAFRCR